jgi:hypothetical protein
VAASIGEYIGGLAFEESASFRINCNIMAFRVKRGFPQAYLPLGRADHPTSPTLIE